MVDFWGGGYPLAWLIRRLSAEAGNLGPEHSVRPAPAIEEKAEIYQQAGAVPSAIPLGYS